MTVSRKFTGVGRLCLWLALWAWSGLVFAQKPELANASCQGPLAQKTWQLWDDAGQAWAQQVLQTRLLERGDTYVLYDLQTLHHNLLAMGVRCKQWLRVRQLAHLAQTAYTQLEPDALGSPLRRWVCRGGAVCNSVNRLVNTEVMLTSVQFLAFAAHAANALQGHSKATPADQQFALQTAQVLAEHLLRWGDAKAVQALQASLKATRDDVKDGSSRYFLTDKVLWQLSIYAYLAGMLQRDAAMQQALSLTPEQWVQLRKHAGALAGLVKHRTQLTSTPTPGGVPIQVADLDAGFWRHYKDNRYAADEAPDKPAICETDAQGKRRAVIKRPHDTLPLRQDIGWDLSHARRLVHFFDAIDSQSVAMQKVWQLPMEVLPSQAVMKAFAQQLHRYVWNQDAQRPLFANYYSGANGWYRVAYDNGTGRCSEGYPPHGLTDSFPTGGFVTWGQWVPQLGVLGWQLLALAESTQPEDLDFMSRYYRGLTPDASPQVLRLQQLMFWPTLVQQP